MRTSKGEATFRRKLRELEAARDRLTDGQRREVAAARRHLKIHSWFHYAKIIGDIHRATFPAAARGPQQ